MGLIYSSSDSAQLISALKKNLQSGKEASEQLKAGSQKVIAAVDGKTLSGAAYTAGKGLFSELVLPTISKVTSAMSTIEQELQTYTSADQNISSEGTLDEDKLNQQIATKKAMKASVDASAAVVRSLSRNNPVAKVLDGLLDVQNKLNRMSNTFEEDIRELQKKLEKLHQFFSQTNSLFASSLNDMKIAMQGVMVLNNTVVNSDGTYQLPAGVDSSWFNQLKEKKQLDALNEDKQPDVGDREYKLIDLGYGKMWLWVEKGKNFATAADIDVTLAYNKWLSQMIDKYGLSFIQGDRPKGIDELFYEQNATLIKELKTGIDSVTGKKLTTMEMIGKASLLANGMITIGVMAKGVVNVGKVKNATPRNAGKKAGGANQKVISELESPVLDGQRVGSGAKVDDVKPIWGKDSKGKPVIEKEFPHVPKEHGFPDIVDNYPSGANEFPLVGGDGVNRRFFQIEGSHNGKTGVFEWIIEPNGNISHRRFIDGGVLTGKPNQVPKK
ncbi:T7SS effector LXG polymorphic toxin [Candidatus Enterococcus mansonii]|uniref:LXG domain-containing protein n=1 Tax=Candidatus Enterococcus mansonii TaxID=1834181 RepID=A0ABU8ICU0_9ENTE